MTYIELLYKGSDFGVATERFGTDYPVIDRCIVKDAEVQVIFETAIQPLEDETPEEFAERAQPLLLNQLKSAGVESITGVTFDYRGVVGPDHVFNFNIQRKNEVSYFLLDGQSAPAIAILPLVNTDTFTTVFASLVNFKLSESTEQIINNSAPLNYNGSIQYKR